MAGFTQNLQKILFHHSQRNNKYLNLVQPKFFDNEHIRLAFNISKAYYEKVGKAPTASTLHTLVESKKITDKLPNNVIDTIYDCDLSQYDEVQLDKWTQAFILYKNLNTSLREHLEYIETLEDVDVDNVQTVINNALRMYNEKNKISFSSDSGLDIFDPEAHLPDSSSEKMSTGYEYLDLVSGGGISAGELWVFMGRANVGKSIWLSNFSKNFMVNGYNAVYVSLEMSAKHIIARIGANMFNIPIADYFKNVDQQVVKSRIKQFRTDHSVMFDEMGKIWIKQFPASNFSTIDLENFVYNNIEKSTGMKVHVIVVDYINIMSNWRNPNSEDTYMAIKKICEDLRSIAVSNNWAIISATQTNRGGYNKSNMGMQDVAESAGLLHTVDYLGGIIQDVDMKSKFVYDIKTLKNRNGGYVDTRQRFNISYDYMTITQDADHQYYLENT